jgi:riboflavin kinase
MNSESSLCLEGQVSDGFGEGAAFVELDGYKDQFAEVLGYEPYPGTLNVVLTDDTPESIEDMADLEPLVVEGWSDGDTEYGPVYCYPATLQAGGDSEPVHVVRPVRTRHDEATLELLSSHNLRNRVGLESGDPVTVDVGYSSEH